MTVLSVDALSVRYGRTLVLDDVSLPSVQAGEVLGVIGPNGSGKSTLLRTLALARGLRGNVVVNGIAIREFGIRQRRRTFAYVPQALPQPSALLAYELLVAHAQSAGLAGPHTQSLLEDLFARLGLADLAMRPMRELSGGKRQLVGFALAAMQGAPILLLDEPTSALDLSWQIGLMREVRRYTKEQSGASLVALHDLGLAARTCDKLVLLAEGRVAASGPPEDVITKETLAAVYGVAAQIGRRGDGHLSIEVLGRLDEGECHVQSDGKSGD